MGREERSSYKDIRIEDKIKSFKRLPVLPVILVRLIEACNDENISLHEIASLIGTDAGLTSRVLFLANSAYYGTYQRIEHIDQAVFRMGKKTLKSVVMSAAVHEVFKGYNGQDLESLRKFWRHSLLTALIARRIAIRTAQGDADQAFFAGLVHDIGRLVLKVNFPEAYRELMDWDGSEASALLAEESKLVAPHPVVAAWLLEKWNLDSMIVDAVLYHHESLERIAGAFPLVKIVFSANILARMTESHHVRLEPVMSLFDLSPEDTTRLIVEAEEELDDMAKSLEIDIGAKKGEKKYEFLRERVEDMAHMFAPMDALIAARDEQEIVSAIYQSIRVLCDVEEAILLIYDGEGKTLVSYGDPFSKTMSIPGSQIKGLLLKGMDEGEVITSLDVPEEERSLMDEQLLRRLGKKVLIVSPLSAFGAKVGTIVFGLEERDRSLIERVKPLLKLISSVAAAAIKVERMKREEARRVQEERLKAIHNLMRRIAHEINNPLSIMKNYLAILASRLGDHSSVEREIGVIREEIDRISRLLPELSVTEEKQKRAKGPVSLNTLIEEMMRILKPIAQNRGIELNCHLAPLLPDLYGDRDAMKQIVMNLVKNAFEALEKGGKVNIETKVEPGRSRGSEVVVEISDNGPGISPHIQAHLFEPCVSTKGKGHAGLGLSIVYQLVKEHGGEIDWVSKTGEGTRFIVRLPVANKNGV